MTYKSKGIRKHKEDCMCCFHGGRISKKGISHVAGCMCPWHGGESGSNKSHKNTCTCNFCFNARIPIENIAYKVKATAIKRGLLREQCYICGSGKVWMGKIIVLQLDHIDGDNKNNNIENLRLLCPNCHSQTNTFGIGILDKSQVRPIF